MTNPAPEEVLDYWYREVGADHWFTPDAARDAAMRERFAPEYKRAVDGALIAWEENPTGMLGLMLLLDQFPRHMFRNTPQAFATDDTALDLARTAIIKHYDDRIDASYKLCFYLPFAHSEALSDQRLSLFYIRERTKNPGWLDCAEHHFQTIQKFERFPERNKILGRPSTAEEESYLQKPVVEF